MRLGAPVDGFTSPHEWIAAVKRGGYRAAYCPLDADSDSQTRAAYVHAAAQADIVIAEVGAWSNPISPDDTVRRTALAYCQQQLALADEVGARCCVNIAGARGAQWDGPYADNYSADTFALIVDTVREIIDAVRPTRTYYALETMPWIVPDSPESYLELLRAIDRPQFGVHLDPVNMITSPRLYVHNGAFLEHCFRLLGAHIKSCHAKDILLRPALTVHLDEVAPGAGNLDYGTYLRCLQQLDDVPLMLEHLPMEQYTGAAAHLRKLAHALELTL